MLTQRKVIRFVAVVTLLLTTLFAYYFIIQGRPLVLHRHSPVYLLLLFTHGLLLTPFIVTGIAVAASPSQTKTTQTKGLLRAFTVVWALLLMTLILDVVLFLFVEPQGFYFAVLLAFSFLATGKWLRLWNESLFAQWKAIALRATAASLGLLFAIGACECALRIKSPALLQPRFDDTIEFCVFHPSLGWVNRPRATGYFQTALGDFEHPVKINGKGLRDREYDYAKRPGVKRIVCLGDSYGWGWGVKNSEILTEALENKLKGVEVINAGVAGWGTTQEWIWLRDEGVKYHPDLVILCFFVNDFDNNVQPTNSRPWCQMKNGVLEVKNTRVVEKKTLYRPDYTFFKVALNRHSYVYRLLKFARTKLQETRSRPKKPAPSQPAQSAECRSLEQQTVDPQQREKPERPLPGEDVAEELIQRIQKTSAEMGAKFLVVLIPPRWEVRPSERNSQATEHTWWGVHYRALKICQRRKLDYLDLRPPIADSEERGRKAYFAVDGHWNAAGHRLAAEAIHRKIMDDGLLK